MFRVTGSKAAVGLDPGALWRALLDKAADPVPYVPAISGCRVLRRDARGLEREIVLRGERLRERATFFPRRAVRFERLSGRARGTIWNRVERDERGNLALRFVFALEVAGLEPGSAAEEAFARVMSASYLHALETTLRRARERFGRRAAV